MVRYLHPCLQTTKTFCRFAWPLDPANAGTAPNAIVSATTIAKVPVLSLMPLLSCATRRGVALMCPLTAHSLLGHPCHLQIPYGQQPGKSREVAVRAAASPLPPSAALGSLAWQASRSH